MTKKHFQHAAVLISDAVTVTGVSRPEQARLTEAFINLFSQFAPRFRPQRFRDWIARDVEPPSREGSREKGET